MGCFELLTAALADYGVSADQIADPFNLAIQSTLREARQKAIEYAATRKAGVPTDHVSGLIDHLLNRIGSGP